MGNMNRQLEASHEVHEDCVVVTACGQVDVLTASEFAEVLTAARDAAEPSDPVIVDLRGIEFLGVQGVSQLLDTHRACLQMGTPFRIIADHRAVLRPLCALGFDSTFEIVARMEPALARLATQRENSPAPK